ncbi:MAG: YggS family pyridoxal phosphate enzyme [Elusimicrobia bacterium GWA2_61_42]|nr:MAG: YggS family pyridoxal phosphate enzyme [Elusimicrobia bacterium GWA2_61_42]OGR74383.1 MAG: YggS family pyridoxal phosphate enzyme [Elusimicrobia bacterium GWC2_61_25]
MPTAELTRKSALLSNFQTVTGRIASACGRTGRKPADVEVLAVTKYAADEDVITLIQAGAIKTAGENKVQDARTKWTSGALAPLRARVKLHFIGHLQTNKAKAAVETFDWIDSIDSLKIAVEVNRHAEALGKTMPVLIQLKLNDSAAQSGVTPAQAGELLAGLRGLKNLVPCGYLGIAPAGAQPEKLKAVFAEAKKIFDRDFPAKSGDSGFKTYLSLGMSGDYELAVEAGSNLPRVGSSLFA